MSICKPITSNARKEKVTRFCDTFCRPELTCFSLTVCFNFSNSSIARFRNLPTAFEFCQNSAFGNNAPLARARLRPGRNNWIATKYFGNCPVVVCSDALPPEEGGTLCHVHDVFSLFKIESHACRRVCYYYDYYLDAFHFSPCVCMFRFFLCTRFIVAGDYYHDEHASFSNVKREQRCAIGTRRLRRRIRSASTWPERRTNK